MSLSQGLESCASGLGRDKGKQVDKLMKEQEVLLASLKLLIAKGWKSDNSFRGGYLNKLEELMNKKFPGTDLKGVPHLHSKIQTWKRNYNSLTTMLSRSGMGFTDNMIDCSDEVWEEIIKCDPNAKAMRGQTWHMFEDWKEIFGKDRATGDHAEDVLDAVNDLINQDKHSSTDASHKDYNVNLDEIDDASTWEQTTCGTENGAMKDSPLGAETGEGIGIGVGKKRKTRLETDVIAEVLREMGRNTDARLDALVSRIGHEYDMDKAIKEAFALLDDIPGLSTKEKFDVCEIFRREKERLLIFQGLPESARPQYVFRVLKSKHN